MAGQRMYYSNVQTNTKGSVQATAQVNFAATAQPSVVTGAGIAIVGSGNTTTYTVQVPERFAANRVGCLSVNWVNAATTTRFEAIVATAYTVPASVNLPASCQVQFFQTGTLGNAIAQPTGTLYFSLEAALGM